MSSLLSPSLERKEESQALALCQRRLAQFPCGSLPASLTAWHMFALWVAILEMRVLVPLPPTGCVTLPMFLPFSVPLFPLPPFIFPLLFSLQALQGSGFSLAPCVQSLGLCASGER